jgi:hypothetical protein
VISKNNSPLVSRRGEGGKRCYGTIKYWCYFSTVILRNTRSKNKLLLVLYEFKCVAAHGLNFIKLSTDHYVQVLTLLFSIVEAGSMDAEQGGPEEYSCDFRHDTGGRARI